MKILQFKEANTLLKKPEGMKECEDLPCFRGAGINHKLLEALFF